MPALAPAPRPAHFPAHFPLSPQVAVKPRAAVKPKPAEICAKVLTPARKEKAIAEKKARGSAARAQAQAEARGVVEAAPVVDQGVWC